MSKERELLESCLDEFQYHEVPCPELVTKIEELLAQPEQTEQEPVAWIYERQTEDFTERTLSVGFEKNFDGITIPLYASPPKRKPLSNEDIANLEILSKTLDSLEYRYGFVNGVLYAEKAHGIGGE